MKTSTYQWFRKSARPARPGNTLGVYRLQPLLPAAFTFYGPAILESLYFGWAESDFARDGNVLLECVFDWVFKDSKIWDLMEQEIAMYEWHLRELGGRGNIGRLRNALYTQVQQLIRGDPLYYVLYACLRPDQNWRLISYRYCMKSAQESDSTYFRHIDINIPSLLEGMGGKQIQSTVALTDEDH